MVERIYRLQSTLPNVIMCTVRVMPNLYKQFEIINKITQSLKWQKCCAADFYAM